MLKVSVYISEATLSSDKFLVSVLQVADTYENRTENLLEVWKSVPRDPTKFLEAMYVFWFEMHSKLILISHFIVFSSVYCNFIAMLNVCLNFVDSHPSTSAASSDY